MRKYKKKSIDYQLFHCTDKLFLILFIEISDNYGKVFTSRYKTYQKCYPGDRRLLFDLL